jgi:hypothetical protein
LFYSTLFFLHSFHVTWIFLAQFYLDFDISGLQTYSSLQH